MAMKETSVVSHQQVVKLLHNKFVVVLGDSIQRSVYKDLVLLLQRDKYLTMSQLRSKGELSFEQDCLVEGGILSRLHNGIEYKEVRQYQSDHHLVRFYFITRIYSSYMKSILSDFQRGPKPDVVIVNSCVWDISRYDSKWIKDYKENLHKFFDELSGVLPVESLVIWNVAMPLAEKIRGGFLVTEIEHKSAHLRSDVIEANFFSGTLANGYGLDVLDLHYQFRFSLHHRAKDGVHWNAIAHRRISWLLLHHMAQAWGIKLPHPLAAVENLNEQQESEWKLKKKMSDVPPRTRSITFNRDDFSDSTEGVSYSFRSFDKPWTNWNNEAPSSRARRYDSSRSYFRTDATEEKHQYLKTRHRHHYAPYSNHRPRPSTYNFY